MGHPLALRPGGTGFGGKFVHPLLDQDEVRVAGSRRGEPVPFRMGLVKGIPEGLPFGFDALRQKGVGVVQPRNRAGESSLLIRE